MRRSTVYTIILGCYMAVLAVLGASLWLNDERLAVIGLLLFTGLCLASAFLITLNEHGTTNKERMMSTTEAADLARVILDDTETDRHMDLYTLTVIEARTLARAVTRVEALADRLENEAAYEASRGDTWDATCIRAEARRIRRALNGETA